MCDECEWTREGVELLVDIAEGRRQPTVVPQWLAKQILAEVVKPRPLIYSKEFAVEVKGA